ncbi:MAG: aminoglycoside phosphotransferase family protein [Alphaproteobacteria bacterium]|nr:aminoglycoside phosphotransferase family protein [Alphaproteobacteria bacterium]
MRDGDEDTMSGLGTSVQRVPTGALFGVVEKVMKPDGAFKDRPEEWRKRILNAKKISDEIRAVGNDAYFVPRTYILFNKVYEQLVPGHKVSDMSWEYFEANRTGLYTAIASFINDMSELRVATSGRPNAKIDGRLVKDAGELDKLTYCFKGIIPVENTMTIKAVYKFLFDLPENRELVFTHGDLHSGNMFVDTGTGKLSVIDLEMAGPQTKFAAMYQSDATAVNDIWDMVDKLPRRKNPGLRWNFDKDKHQTYKYLRRAITDMYEFLGNGNTKDKGEFVEKIDGYCGEMRRLLGVLKSKEAGEVRNNMPMIIKGRGK